MRRSHIFFRPTFVVGSSFILMCILMSRLTNVDKSKTAPVIHYKKEDLLKDSSSPLSSINLESSNIMNQDVNFGEEEGEDTLASNEEKVSSSNNEGKLVFDEKFQLVKREGKNLEEESSDEGEEKNEEEETEMAKKKEEAQKKIASIINKSKESQGTGTISIESGMFDSVPDPNTQQNNNNSKDKSEIINYHHCGPRYNKDKLKGYMKPKEVLLLHGARFSKEDWKTKGILYHLCEFDAELSVVAIDFSVAADGIRLSNAIRGLSQEGFILSGNPLFVVTPSVSAKSVLHLAELALQGKEIRERNEKEKDMGIDASSLLDNSEASSSEEKEKIDVMTIEETSQYLSKYIRAWVPIASKPILLVNKYVLREFRTNRIPVLSVYGQNDEVGRDISKRLNQETGSGIVELTGGRYCYFDDPQRFMNVLQSFIKSVSAKK